MENALPYNSPYREVHGQGDGELYDVSGILALAEALQMPIATSVSFDVV